MISRKQTVIHFREFGVPPEEFDRALGSSSFNPSTEDWVKTQLINGVDYYRRYRDLSYVGVAVWYLITILDANVDATCRITMLVRI